MPLLSLYMIVSHVLSIYMDSNLIHIVWKYKYSYNNSFTPQLLVTYKTLCCGTISIAVSLIQDIMFVKKYIYITPYVLSHVKISNFISNLNHCFILWCFFYWIYYYIMHCFCRKKIVFSFSVCVFLWIGA